MTALNNGDFTIYNVPRRDILFRNFEGKEQQYNRAGKRNFCLVLSEEHAEALSSIGLDVKVLNARNEDEVDKPFIKIDVNMESKWPPEIWVITGHKKSRLTEKSVGILDWADIQNADIRISPYNWEFGGKSGVKAYLRKMFVTVKTDELDAMYADFEEDGPRDDDNYHGEPLPFE